MRLYGPQTTHFMKKKSGIEREREREREEVGEKREREKWEA